jgi:hypothetical protein
MVGRTQFAIQTVVQGSAWYTRIADTFYEARVDLQIYSQSSLFPSSICIAALPIVVVLQTNSCPRLWYV